MAHSLKIIIDELIPSINIFPLDVTYTEPDAIKEIDGGLLTRIKYDDDNNKEKDENKEIKALLLVESLSADETYKIEGEIRLNYIPLIYLRDNENKIINAAFRALITSSKLDEEFKKGINKEYESKYKTLWNFTYDLYHLLFHSLLLSVSARQEIIEDFKRLNNVVKKDGNNNDDINNTLQIVLADILHIASYIANNISSSLEKTKNYSTIKYESICKYISSLSRPEGFSIIFFPQKFNLNDHTMKKKIINVIGILIKQFIKSEDNNPDINVFIAGYKASLDIAREITNELHINNISNNIDVEMMDLANYTEYESKLKDYIIVIILQDFNKSIVNNFLDYAESLDKKIELIVISKDSYYVKPYVKGNERAVQRIDIFDNIDNKDNKEIPYTKILIEKLDRETTGC